LKAEGEKNGSCVLIGKPENIVVLVAAEDLINGVVGIKWSVNYPNGVGVRSITANNVRGGGWAVWNLVENVGLNAFREQKGGHDRDLRGDVSEKSLPYREGTECL